MRTALNRAVDRGETSLADGIYAGMMLGESDAGRSLLIVFSDGLDTSSWLSPDAVASTRRGARTVVCAVAVGTSPKRHVPPGAQRAHRRTFFRVESTANLGATFLGILDEFRHRYLASYTPRGVAKVGGTGWT